MRKALLIRHSLYECTLITQLTGALKMFAWKLILSQN